MCLLELMFWRQQTITGLKKVQFTVRGKWRGMGGIVFVFMVMTSGVMFKIKILKSNVTTEVELSVLGDVPKCKIQRQHKRAAGPFLDNEMGWLRMQKDVRRCAGKAKKIPCVLELSHPCHDGLWGSECPRFIIIFQNLNL